MKGFTLIELLVVVLIIGILAAIALPQYKNAIIKSRFLEMEGTMRALAKAEQACVLAKGESCALDELAIEVPECKCISDEICTSCRYSVSSGAVTVVGQYYNTVFILYLQEANSWIDHFEPGDLIAYHSAVSPKMRKALGFTVEMATGVSKRP